jgi:parvulin-like peptidyl-prolyl isomerase
MTEEDIRKDTEESLLVLKFSRNSMELENEVTEEQVRKYYDDNKKLFMNPETREVLHILVKSPPGDSESNRETAREKIDKAYARIQEGADFGEIAKEYSETPNAVSGGRVSSFPRGKMVPQFEERAFTLKVGDISEVFETAYGFNIIKVIGRQEASLIPYEEIRPTLTVEYAKLLGKRAFSKKMEQVRSRAKIEIMKSSLFPEGKLPEIQAGGEPTPSEN